MSVRFGVALPREIADELEKMAKSMNVTRSKVVELAIRSFLNYLKALNDPERAKFIIVLTKHENLATVVRELNGSNMLTIISDGNKALIVVKSEDGKEIFRRLSKVKCSIYPIALPE